LQAGIAFDPPGLQSQIDSLDHAAANYAFILAPNRGLRRNKGLLRNLNFEAFAVTTAERYALDELCGVPPIVGKAAWCAFSNEMGP
jgi:hypothetical protein